MPFTTGAVSLGAIQDLWDRYSAIHGNTSISFSDFYRTTNADNYHSEGLPIATSTSDLSLSDFRGTPVPQAGLMERINASGYTSTTDFVATSQRFNPGIDLTVDSAWITAGRSGGVPAAFTTSTPTIFLGSIHYFFANSGTYLYFQDEDNPGLNGAGDFARVTLSTAYDITTPTTSSYVDYATNTVDLRTIVDANKPASRHATSTNAGTPDGTVPNSIYMKDDGTKIWGVALDMRWMSESGSSSDGDTLVEFTLTTAYDISTATWSTYHVFTDDNVKNPGAMGFSADGTVLLVDGRDYYPSNPRLSKYNLSSAWNISTISYSGSTSYSTLNSNFEVSPINIDFYQGLSSSKPTKAFFTSTDLFATPQTTYYSYDMSVTGSSPTFTLTGSTSSDGALPFANGSKRLVSASNVVNHGFDTIPARVVKVLSLSTAYDYDTLGSYNPATFATTTPTGVTLVDGDINVEHQGWNFKYPNVCICWSSDGTKVFYLGQTTSDTQPKIYTENCTTPWTLEGVNFNVSSTTNSTYTLPWTSSRYKALGIELNNDGTKLFITWATYLTSGSFFNRTYYSYNYILEFDMTAYAPNTIANNGTVLTQSRQHTYDNGYSSSSIEGGLAAYNLQTRFSTDGLSLLLLQVGNERSLNQRTLTTAYDITTSHGYAYGSIPTNTASSTGHFGLRLAKGMLGTGTFWGDNDYIISDVGIDGYSVIAQYFPSNQNASSAYQVMPFTEADNKVVLRTINQDDSTLPNVVASLFSSDRLADGFSTGDTDVAQDWSSGITSAGPGHSLEVKKEFILNSSGRWPFYHAYKYLPNGSILQFCSFFDDDVPNFFRIVTTK